MGRQLSRNTARHAFIEHPSFTSMSMDLSTVKIDFLCGQVDSQLSAFLRSTADGVHGCPGSASEAPAQQQSGPAWTDIPPSSQLPDGSCACKSPGCGDGFFCAQCGDADDLREFLSRPSSSASMAETVSRPNSASSVAGTHLVATAGSASSKRGKTTGMPRDDARGILSPISN